MKTVLCYGHDLPLLVSRKLLLKTEGYQVLTLTDVSLMENIAVPVDLLVLCHSVPHEYGLRALSIAESRWPGVLGLLLETSTVRRPFEGAAKFSTEEGPAKFVTVVKELLPLNGPVLAKHQLI
jgi:hypothetical protein